MTSFIVDHIPFGRVGGRLIDVKDKGKFKETITFILVEFKIFCDFFFPHTLFGKHTLCLNSSLQLPPRSSELKRDCSFDGCGIS